MLLWGEICFGLLLAGRGEMESSIIVTVITSIISDGTNINSNSANKKSIDDNNSTIMITIFIVGNLRTKIMIIATIIISQRRSIFRGHFELPVTISSFNQEKAFSWKTITRAKGSKMATFSTQPHLEEDLADC